VRSTRAFLFAAGTAFLLDPRQGERRRHVLRARSLALVRLGSRLGVRKARLAGGHARAAVALSRRLHGPLDQQALHSEIYLARTLIARGEPAAAESMLRADLSGLQRIHGGDHPATGEALRKLGHALIALRRYPEAAACLERALGVFRRFLDERHTMLARVRVHQAELELERGEAAKAVAIAHDALDRFARLGLTEHPAALDTRRILGRALLALDDRAAAVSVLEGCLELEERLFVAADARTEQTRAALALARAIPPARPSRRAASHQGTRPFTMVTPRPASSSTMFQPPRASFQSSKISDQLGSP